jgi:RimJ/RimL family protein N-acetyltransferase
VTQTPDFATKPTLIGERVILRPYIDADLPALRAAMADLDLLRLTGSIHDEAEAFREISPEEEQFRLDWFNSRNDTDDRLDLAIVDQASGACVGEAVLNQWDPGNQSCNFRILIGPAGQNRGLGTEATRLIVGCGFEQLGLHRISLEVYAFNPRPPSLREGRLPCRGRPARIPSLRRPVDRRHRHVHPRPRVGNSRSRGRDSTPEARLG